MRALSKHLLDECRQKLVEAKAEILNRVRAGKDGLVMGDRGGDEADQTVRLLAERDFVAQQDRLRRQLVEIELALSRIESGSYGVCEETEEPIEAERLRAIPWTRLSIEGAEMREDVSKRYAR